MGERASRMRRASSAVSSRSSMLEGLITLTVMPLFASSMAREREKETTAALAAATWHVATMALLAGPALMTTLPSAADR